MKIQQIDKAKIALAAYALLQVVVLIILRKWYLMTVYQTAVFYLAVSLVGMAVLFLDKYGLVRRMQYIYLLLWSSVHGIVVLGFLTKGTFYLTLTQLNGVQVINFFLGFAVFWCGYAVTKRVRTAVGAGNLMVGIVGVTNHYLVRFRGAPFQISDIRAMRTAGNVIQSYDYTPDALMVAAVADLIIWYALICRVQLPERRKQSVVSAQTVKILQRVRLSERKRTSEKVKLSERVRWQIQDWLLTGLVLFGVLALFMGPYPEYYARTGQFAKDNYLADLLADIRGNTAEYPEGYSVEEAERILSEHTGVAVPETAGQQPNIVVIMNEAFSDLRVLGEINTDTPFLDHWDLLQENCMKGFANVSVLGGTTANSEYEFLTSDATALYMGNGSIPYNNYFESGEAYPGLVSVLKEQGYETTAFHPYYSSGWNRTAVYRAMQFDHLIFLENLQEELDTLRLYTSDKGDYEFLKQWFEKKEKGTPQFFFNVTMQNHSGYTYEGEEFETTVHLTGEAENKYPQAEQYLSLIKASDEALAELLEYFESYEEPVIVLFFGDHQPNLELEFYSYLTGMRREEWGIEQQANQYKTPFLIWHNYETKYLELGDVSVNYLASLLLSDAGLEMSAYQNYLLEKMEELPVVNTVMAKDAEGNCYPRGNAEYGKLTREMQMLVYYHTVDEKGDK